MNSDLDSRTEMKQQQQQQKEEKPREKKECLTIDWWWEILKIIEEKRIALYDVCEFSET